MPGGFGRTMIHRTARERLVAEAKGAAEHLERIEGIRGHSATLERSEHGPSRIVRVWHNGTVVTWSFSLEPGEARPGFYPPDLPFWPDMHCEVTWDDESGLVVQWREPVDPQRQARFRENLESFKNRVQELTGEPLASGSQVTPAQRREALGVLAGKGQEESLEPRVSEIVACHEAAGWSLASGPSSGPMVRVTLRRGATERSVLASSFGVTMIVLGEEGPGSGESDQHGPGPARPRAGLRLRMDGGVG